mmetsp:Transcript_753/g.1333  ORF Transcript_753/g.1333 Transcript_753/m.1333 type:complete len:304 (-) Transcript_753:666-1577(-)
MPSSGHVCRSVKILSARIKQDRIGGVQILEKICAFFGTVMDNCTIATNTGNGRETKFQETWLFGPTPSENLINFNFTDRATFLHNGMFEPAYEFGHGCTVHNMSLLHSLHLSLVLAGFHRCDCVLGVHKTLLRNDGNQCKVGAGLVNPDLGFGFFAMSLDVSDNAIIGLQGDCRKVLFHLRRLDFGAVTIQDNVVLGYSCVRNADRTGCDVAHCPHVEQVCDVIESTEDSHSSLFLLHFVTNLGNLVGYRYARILHRMDTERRGGNGRTILSPYGINEVGMRRDKLSDRGIVVIHLNGSSRSE